MENQYEHKMAAMKKLVLLFIIIFSFSLASCGSSSKMTVSADADGNQTISDKYGTTVYPEKLPCSFQYNDEKIVVENFGVYQLEDNYEWYLFALAELDLSGLSDKSFHWMFEDENLKCSVTLDGGENNFESKYMEQYGKAMHYSDTKKYKACWISPVLNQYRESFDGTEIRFHVLAKQEDGLWNRVYYEQTPETIPYITEMSPEEKRFFTEKLEEFS